MNAVQERSTEKVLFLHGGADPNAVDRRGFTALHRAAELGEMRIIELLLDRGALPHLGGRRAYPAVLGADAR
jgi:ankyrin repeat protein